MRRMTTAEQRYYAEKQKEADKKAKIRNDRKIVIAGIAMLMVMAIIAGIGAGAENNTIFIWLMIAIIPVVLYFIAKE